MEWSGHEEVITPDLIAIIDFRPPGASPRVFYRRRADRNPKYLF